MQSAVSHASEAPTVARVRCSDCDEARSAHSSARLRWTAATVACGGPLCSAHLVEHAERVRGERGESVQHGVAHREQLSGRGPGHAQHQARVDARLQRRHVVGDAVDGGLGRRHAQRAEGLQRHACGQGERKAAQRTTHASRWVLRAQKEGQLVASRRVAHRRPRGPSRSQRSTRPPGRPRAPTGCPPAPRGEAPTPNGAAPGSAGAERTAEPRTAEAGPSRGSRRLRWSCERGYQVSRYSMHAVGDRKELQCRSHAPGRGS